MSADIAPRVSFVNVSKSFGTRRILSNVSFDIHAGQALCLLGRSGTGKSVTLKLMMALMQPDEGEIRIHQESIARRTESELSRIRRKMGYLFQSAALFDSFSLHDNLALPLRRLTKKSEDEIESIIDLTLDQVGLKADKQKLPGEMSGGMQKRAGLARALVLDPTILLVDEPSSGLDRITASEIDHLLLRRKQERNTTLIIVTHDTRGARRVGDRFAVLDRGDLLAFGTASDLDQHGNPVVRELIAE